MSLTGHCYCGRIHFEAAGEPLVKGLCYCRECQVIAGGGPNHFLAVPAEGFVYTKGAPKTFARDDLPRAVTREFCGDCGTPLTSRNPKWPFVIVKVGTLDDPAAFTPAVAMQLADKQPFHRVPEGLPQFDRWPPN